MSRYLLISLMILLCMAGCASRNATIHYDLTQETWMRYVNTSPSQWTMGADSWFITGDPNWAEIANRNAPYSAAISTMSINVPEFSSIHVDGDFQVQLFGTCDPNSVYVFGPNAAVREVAVEVRGNVLWLHQTKNAPNSVRQVIIRIGINQLNSIVKTSGCGSIEGIHLQSNALYVTSLAPSTGNMYLAGNLNLRCVTNSGAGVISVFGAHTSSLDIRTSGRGGVNVSGRVGLRSIMHGGTNDINILGSMPINATTIYADGVGKIGINGNVNLTNIKTKNKARVYAYPVTSHFIYAYAYDHSQIGLAGYTNDAFVDTSDHGQFEGRYLCTQNAYVRARGYSHINVAACNKIFASATQNASVYFYGSPELMSQFVSTNGVVMPIWTNAGSACVANYHPLPPPPIYQAPMIKEEVIRVRRVRPIVEKEVYTRETTVIKHKTAEVPYEVSGSVHTKKTVTKSVTTSTTLKKGS